MEHSLIVDQQDFEVLCERLHQAGTVAFDTEFVSENTYRPELCLLQFAYGSQCVAVDPFEVGDLSSWWELMADEETEVLVHAGREEVRFCVTHSGKRPRRLIDVQVAQGLVSRSYPLAYASLVSRVLGEDVRGTQTRTDWRRRPLSAKQIHYALDDVRYIEPVWDAQRAALEERGRVDWAYAEFDRMIDEVARERDGEPWRKLSGLKKLNRRELALVRALYEWREREAERCDRPPRRVLRDDLLLDLARRKPRTPRDVLATRDMNRRHLKNAAESIAECIVEALELPDDQLPTTGKRSGANKKLDEELLGRILGIALANRCAELDIATSLVGTNPDLRHLVRWHTYGEKRGEPPRLTLGWRAEVCGELLTKMLDGRIALRVADPSSDHPLVFEERKQ